MPKRTFWTTVGYSAGIATSVWAQRRVRRALARVAPPDLRDAAGARGSALAARARRVGDTVVVAVREGRGTMRDTEAQLHDEFDRPPLRRVQ